MTNSHLLPLNRIGIPAAYLASADFNLSPVPLHIDGVIEMNASLFQAMDRLEKDDAPSLFMEYMRGMFDLDTSPAPGKRRNNRASYLRLLSGWFFDSNRPEGAVMKGWAESRFGLIPLFHREPIPDLHSPAYRAYVFEKMNPRFHNNAIFSQLDLLYEYAQYFLRRFYKSSESVTLYRGVNRLADDHPIVQKISKKRWVARNNSLVSYTSEKERASEFGDFLLQIKAPYEKILSFPDLLPGTLPSSESEYILLGGDYLSEIIDL